MEEASLKQLGSNEERCATCNLVIPYVFEKGPQYTCPSFTIVDSKKVCYYCYHPRDYEAAKKKRLEKNM